MKNCLTLIHKLFIGIGILTVTSAQAQVATTYTFSQSVGTYTPITGETVIANTAMGNMDDAVFLVNIPAFSFDWNSYSFIYVSTNGFITFGPIAPQTNDTYPLSDNRPHNGIIAAFGMDIASAQAAAGERKISYAQVGDEFVVQWQNMRRFQVNGEQFSFQIRLNTATNEIAVVYGGTIVPANDDYYPQVGLRGPDNTFATNINNRSVLSGPWSASVAGTDEFSMCYLGSSTPAAAPESGLRYTWAPVADLAANRLVVSGAAGCYSQETVGLEVKNVGGSAYNFATSPVTVSATIAGPVSATLPVVTVNSGTIAPGATYVIPLSAASDFSMNGTYTLNATLSGDLKTSNNTGSNHQVINTRPVATYADVSFCAGSDVTLSGVVTAPTYLVTTTNSTPMVIPDNNPAGATSSIVVLNAGSAPIASAIVTIARLEHSYTPDLTLRLTAPDGSSVILMTNANGGSGFKLIGTVFSNDGTTPIANGINPFTGNFLPQQNFSLLTGSPNGTWQLKIVDNNAEDIGVLQEWSIAFPISNSIVAYSWTPSTDLSDATIASPVASPDNNTIYAVTVTDQRGCITSDTLQVTVNSLPNVTANSNAAGNEICAGSTITLSGNGAENYSWPTPVTDNVAFIPTATDTYTVTGTDANGCEATADITITVNSLPAVTQTAFSVVCANASDVTLFGGFPMGGTYSGTGVTAGAFDPSAGTQAITYTYTDANGCSSEVMETFTVNAVPVVTQTTFTAVCADETDVVTLSGGSPMGGSYSGTGVTAGAFDPSAGTQTITYTYTDANGCSDEAMETFTVNAVPVVAQTAFTATCANSDEVTLSGGSPTGGTYSGTGVTAGAFDPSAGTQAIVYTYTDANGCTDEAMETFTVNTLPVVAQTTFSAVCADAANITLSGGSPTGGIYSGTGVVTGVFDPSAGTQAITYTYTDANGCAGEAVETLHVNNNPNTNLAISTEELCVYNESIVLSGGSPMGGTYSGAGVNTGSFDPATAGLGTHTVTYLFTDANGCAASATDVIDVVACLGIAEKEITAMLVAFPNPGNGLFTISLSEDQQLSDVKVFDLQGKLVEHVPTTQQEKFVKIDLTAVNNGVYFLQGMLNGESVSVRLIRQ